MQFLQKLPIFLVQLGMARAREAVTSKPNKVCFLCMCQQTNLPIFKLKESSVRRRYSDFEWLRAELEKESKVRFECEFNTMAPVYSLSWAMIWGTASAELAVFSLHQKENAVAKMANDILRSHSSKWNYKRRLTVLTILHCNTSTIYTVHTVYEVLKKNWQHLLTEVWRQHGED